MLTRPRLTVLLHDREELDNDLGRRTDQDLALAALLGVVDGVKGIVEDGSLDHFCGCRARFSNGEEVGGRRYLLGAKRTHVSPRKP